MGGSQLVAGWVPKALRNIIYLHFFSCTLYVKWTNHQTEKVSVPASATRKKRKTKNGNEENAWLHAHRTACCHRYYYDPRRNFISRLSESPRERSPGILTEQPEAAWPCVHPMFPTSCWRTVMSNGCIPPPRRPAAAQLRLPRVRIRTLRAATTMRPGQQS